MRMYFGIKPVLTPHLKLNPDLSEDTRLWAYLQNISSGTWGGYVYNFDKVIERLQ